MHRADCYADEMRGAWHGARAQGRCENRTYHSPVPRILIPSIRLLVGLVVAGAAMTACGAAAFDPSAPCTEDGRAPGAYPALERTLPMEYSGRPADSVDSGRNCEGPSLGTLTAHGVGELRYAGAIWDQGSAAAVSFAVLEADDLAAAWVAEFYEASARAGRRVEEVTVAEIGLGETQGTRIDALNGESYQTVVVAPGEAADQVRVVIVANPIRQIETREAHESVVLGALTFVFEGFCCN